MVADRSDPLFVLVGGWPGAGKSTLARALALELGLSLLAKDEIKEALADALGRPESVPESRRLGEVAVRVMLRVARTCPGAVLDSTWFEYSRPLALALPGRLVEVRCVAPMAVARARYAARAASRDPGHLDLERSERELWGRPSRPLGIGRLVVVDTSGSYDVTTVAARVRRAAGGGGAP